MKDSNRRKRGHRRASDIKTNKLNLQDGNNLWKNQPKISRSPLGSSQDHTNKNEEDRILSISCYNSTTLFQSLHIPLPKQLIPIKNITSLRILHIQGRHNGSKDQSTDKRIYLYLLRKSLDIYRNHWDQCGMDHQSFHKSSCKSSCQSWAKAWWEPQTRLVCITSTTIAPTLPRGKNIS